jgi:hypothetical protein
MSIGSSRLIETFPELKAVQLAAARVHRTRARLAFYKYLRAVYRVVWRWGLAKRRRTITLAALTGRQGQVGLQPYRVIINATYPSLEAKMASRWTRALEYAHEKNVPPSRLPDFFAKAGGVANCARNAANTDPKKKRPEPWDHWIDR